MAEALKKHGVTKGWRIFVSHATNQEKVDATLKILREALPEVPIDVMDLSPAFITQGGPECLTVQYILE